MKIKKLLALLLCVPFVLLACASCGKNITPDYSKIKIPTEFPENDEHYILENEEQFNESLNTYVETMKAYGFTTADIVIYLNEPSNEFADEALANLNCVNVKTTETSVSFSVLFENMDTKAIADLTANEKVKSIDFLYKLVSNPT